jgi:type IV pilus assembly protein PilC
MPSFTYTARDDSGAAVSGTIAAASLAEVGQLLRHEGKYPISVAPVELSRAGRSARGTRGVKISRAEVIQFSTQLGIMVETGVTLTEALDCIAQQAEKPHVRALVEDLSHWVQSGTDLSTALSRHPRSFPRLYIALIKASEKSGMMSKLLNRATNYLRDEQETLRRVKGALTYPAIMLGFAVLTTMFLLVFVLPRFTGIYGAKGAVLPMPTRVLMGMSNALIDHWLMILTGSLVLTVVGYLYFSTSSGLRALHTFQLRVPLLGPMFCKLHLARGLRMIGTMAGVGVNLVECVATANDLCSNTHFRRMWTAVSDQIQAGKQMSEPLAQSGLVPRSIAQMLHSGEKSGKLAQVMEQVAAYSEQELKEKIAELTRYIEPAMIVLMGIIIGGVALALMLPIFTISRVVAQ